jgi:hypothetical protein
VNTYVRQPRYPDKATREREERFRREAKRIAHEFWVNPKSFLHSVRSAMELAYSEGRRDQAFQMERRP